MFTGIVEEIGVVEKVIQGNLMQLTVRAQKVMEQTKIGDSISVNGVCLTVVLLGKDSVTFEIMKETQEKANLKTLKNGDKINLERAMGANSRFDGHIVSGHIDGTGKIKNKIANSGEFVLEIEADKNLIAYLVPKGSICIDGISLTIVDVKASSFSIGLIPQTLKTTTLGIKQTNDKVNLEVDLLSKYVFRYMDNNIKAGTKISENYLRNLGFGED
ncbi:MAG: riboflavin synthase [Candidatus Omnitrophica bacterium]|nr:riboflavin synthase [Candidatus Omnitrophota bacterium]